jgi:lactoylglutathione lyase
MNYTGVALELTHNHGTESDPAFKGYDSGNNEPKRGFGHIALHCDDVYASAAALEKRGVTFKKRPDEGRMKGIAFFYDPGQPRRFRFFLFFLFVLFRWVLD